MNITCPQCHHQNPDDTEFCEQCGAQLPVAAAVSATPSGGQASNPAPTTSAPGANQLVCPTCQAPLAAGDEFCFNCGTDVRNLTNQGPNSSQPGTPNGAAHPAPVVAANPNDMSDDAINRALSEIDSSAAGGASVQPAVNQVGPEAQPAVVPPQQSPAPPVANTSGGSIPVPPGPDGGVVANAFGAPVVSAGQSSPTGSNGNLTSTPAGTGLMRLHIAGPYGDDVIEWKGKEILLGRNDPKTRVFPEVNLDDSAASRRHLAIWKEDADGRYYAQDLESANGTNLNGQDLRPGEATELHDGDILKIGTRYNIQVKIN